MSARVARLYRRFFGPRADQPRPASPRVQPMSATDTAVWAEHHRRFPREKML